MQPQQRLDQFRVVFDRACERAGRKTNEVEILPVSKGQSVEKIKEYLKLPGFPQMLGENYVEELAIKALEIEAVKWHFLGTLQSRKIPKIIEEANVIQTVNREKELEFLRKSPKDVKFYLQINISNEGQKQGASFFEARGLLEKIHELELDTSLVGFMGIASDLSTTNEGRVRGQFASLRNFRDNLFPAGKLSMGMSADFSWAIAEGSDLVRVGSLLFGAR